MREVGGRSVIEEWRERCDNFFIDEDSSDRGIFYR